MTQLVEDEQQAQPPFEPSEQFERLLLLRESDPRAFMLRTSEAARRALEHYERRRASAGGGQGSAQ